MKSLHITGLAALLIVTGLLFGNPALGQDACDFGGSHTIQVAVGADGMPQLSYRGGSAEDVNVCVGDNIRWVLTGADRSFFVDFFSGAPFAGAKRLGSHANVVEITVGEVERKAYEYGVEFADGEPMDPRIIVN